MPDDVHAAARVGLTRHDAAPEVNRTRTRAGAALIFAAITLWLAFALMPPAGTNSAAQIVREQRGWVAFSIVVQLVSSIALIPAVLLTAQLPAGAARRHLLAGAALLLIGAGGLGADALLYFAASAGGYLPLMLLQTESVWFLLPLLVAFFAGAVVLAVGLQRAGFISTLPMVIFVAAFVAAVVGGIPAAVLDAGRYAVVLLFLGLCAMGLSRVGWELLRTK